MRSLSSILLSVTEPDALVNDLAQVVETHIAGKSGVSGITMKLGFNALRATRPDITARAVRSLLPDIAKALDPLHADFQRTEGRDFSVYLTAHAAEAAKLVLNSVDGRLATSQNATAKSIYKKFRGAADADLQKLLPPLGSVLSAHMRSAKTKLDT